GTGRPRGSVCENAQARRSHADRIRDPAGKACAPCLGNENGVAPATAGRTTTGSDGPVPHILSISNLGRLFRPAHTSGDRAVSQRYRGGIQGHGARTERPRRSYVATAHKRKCKSVITRNMRRKMEARAGVEPASTGLPCVA